MKAAFAVFIIVLAASPWGFMFLGEGGVSPKKPSGNGEVDTLRASLTRQNQNNGILEGQVRELELDLQTVRSAKTGLELRIEELEANTAALEETRAGVEAELLALKEAYSGMEAQLKASAEKVAQPGTLEVENEDLKARLQTASEEIRRLNAIVNSLSQE